MADGAAPPPVAVSSAFGGWLFQGISQFTQEVLEDLRQVPASIQPPADVSGSGDAGEPPSNVPPAAAAAEGAPAGDDAGGALLPFAPWEGLTQLTWGVVQESKGLVEKATELTRGMAQEVAHGSLDLLHRARDATCEATWAVAADSAALAATVAGTAAQLRQRAADATADLLHESRAVVREASAVAQELSDSLCKASVGAFALQEESFLPATMPVVQKVLPPPPAEVSLTVAEPEVWQPMVGFTEVLKGSKEAVTAGALGTLALTKEVLRESVDATKGVVDVSAQSLGARVQSLDWLARDMFTDALPNDSPVKLQGLVGVPHLQAEGFDQAKGDVLRCLWRLRPAFCTAADILRGTGARGSPREGEELGVDIDAVRDGAGDTLRHHLRALAQAEFPSVLCDLESDTFRWVNAAEAQGADYAAYRAARAAVPDDRQLYDAARRRVEGLVQGAGCPLTLAAIREGTSQPPPAEGADAAVGAFLDRFGVDLEEEWPLLVELQRNGQRAEGGGLTFSPRAGTFAWTAAPFTVDLCGDGDGNEDAVQAVVTALAAHDRQVLNGAGSHLGLLGQHVRPPEVAGQLGERPDVLVLEQRTGRPVALCGPGTVLYARCPALAHCGRALADLWREAVPGGSPPTLQTVELAVADEAVDGAAEWEARPAGPLAGVPAGLLMRLWVRAWHGAAEALVVDAVACRGGMWKTKLLEFLQLRQLAAVEALGQAAVLQNCGGRWELAPDAVALRLAELCAALDAPGLARLEALLEAAAAAVNGGN
eukprot:EG_transcript_3209